MPTQKIYDKSADRHLNIGWGRGLAHVAVGVTEESESGSGLFIDFHDRYRINEAIRTLRRARDAAFGKDE